MRERERGGGGRNTHTLIEKEKQRDSEIQRGANDRRDPFIPHFNRNANGILTFRTPKKPTKSPWGSSAARPRLPHCDLRAGVQ